MKIIGRGLGRTIWMIDPQKFNPDGRSLLDCFNALAKRYRFSKAPLHLQDLNKENAFEFIAGTFPKGKKYDLRVGLLIYNNAVVGDSVSSTESSEEFLQDVAQWVEKEYDLFVDASILRKSYLSNLDVQFDYDPQITNPKLNFVSERLTAQSLSVDGKNLPFYFGGIQFCTENIATPQGIQYRLERKHETEFAKNIYFSTAPLQTQEHIALLEEIDKALQPA